MADLMISNIQVKDNLLNDEKYQYLFSVEEVNKLVNRGVAFRDAYKEVGKQIEEGKFKADTDLQHTHEGSMGNLCNDKIALNFQKGLAEFGFEKVEMALKKLVTT